jgi:hypothetical protein
MHETFEQDLPSQRGKWLHPSQKKKTVGYILDLAGPRTAAIATDPLSLLPPPKRLPPDS